MKILSHRGYWLESPEKNTPQAFIRSFSQNFGTETDVRDDRGKLVISHDPPTEISMLFEDFLTLFAAKSKDLPLAINIKSDGLQQMLKDKIDEVQIQNYFVFDMSIPDTLGYLKLEMPVFVRHSDIEPTPVLYQQATGIWLDAFESDWISEEVISQHLQNNKQVCIVSPELHGYKHLGFWQRIKAITKISEQCMLCTDFPEEAKQFFDA